jgi:hypothetical protein
MFHIGFVQDIANNRGPTDTNLQQQNHQLKLLNMIAASSFNKILKTKQLTPKYCSTKINGIDRQNRKTRRAATRHRINQEIKFLLSKTKTK